MLNATGVIVHTNLGRAPLAEEALAQVVEAARGYSNLELDLRDGARGSRQDHVAALLRRLTGAEAALVVNNNAAALLLALAALAEGREVIVSRGELIEIGDGFRIPDVLARSGARLVEVGTTNRTRARDYERAIGPETALLLRVHQSNFRVVGFTELPRIAELAAVAKRHGLPLLDDLGSGRARLDLPASRRPATRWPRVPISSASPATSCSAAHRRASSSAAPTSSRRLRRHPLQRAVRIDKLSLAALEGTLRLYLDATAVGSRSCECCTSQRAVARHAPSVWPRSSGGTVEETVARAGGGALPLAELPSLACAVDESLAEPLRVGDPPVLGIVRDGKLLLDCSRSATTRSTRSRRP